MHATLAPLRRLPARQPLLFLLLAAAAWLGLYQTLNPASEALVAALPVERDSHLGGALQFFLYDAPKVLLLLTSIVFVMGMINSHFTPERTRAMLAAVPVAVGYVGGQATRPRRAWALSLAFVIGMNVALLALGLLAARLGLLLGALPGPWSIAVGIVVAGAAVWLWRAYAASCGLHLPAAFERRLTQSGSSCLPLACGGSCKDSTSPNAEASNHEIPARASLPPRVLAADGRDDDLPHDLRDHAGQCRLGTGFRCALDARLPDRPCVDGERARASPRLRKQTLMDPNPSAPAPKVESTSYEIIVDTVDPRQSTHSANAQTGSERTRTAYGVWDVGGA